MQTFTTLLDPFPLETFLEKYWAREGLVIPGTDADRFAHLFDWESLNNYLNFYPLKFPEVRVAKSGQTLPEAKRPQDLIEQCRAGGTLVVDRLHERVKAIAEWVSKLRLELGHRCQVNSYCSFPGHQGFSRHFDSHEVFILQLSGHKHWRVFSDTFVYPLAEHRSSQFSPPETDPYIDIILHPGDLLYIPRGHWHYAIAVDEPSLHLTLGIDGPTGIDFSDWLTRELQEFPQWRENLPFLNPDSRENCRKHLRNLVQNWMSLLELNELIDRYLDEQLLQGQPPVQFGFPAQMGYDIFPHGDRTQFYRPRQPVQITELAETGKYEIKTGGKKISLKGIEKSVLERIFAATELSGLDLREWLPGFDWETEIVPFLSRLVKAGILLVRSDRVD